MDVVVIAVKCACGSKVEVECRPAVGPRIGHQEFRCPSCGQFRELPGHLVGVIPRTPRRLER